MKATTTTYQSEALYVCNAGYDLVGMETRSCQANGSWSGVKPFCQGTCTYKCACASLCS